MMRIFFIAVSFLFLFSCQNNNVTSLKEPSQKTVQKEIKLFDENKVYETTEVDIVPDYPGGIDKFYAFLKKNYVIPEDVIENDILGHGVFASVRIEKDGSLSEIKIIRDFGFGTGSELVRVLRISAKWIPAKIQGKPVKCLYTIPYYISVD